MDRNQKKTLKVIVAQNSCIEVIETIGTEKIIEALLSKYAVSEILYMIADGLLETHEADEFRQDVIEQIMRSRRRSASGRAPTTSQSNGTPNLLGLWGFGQVS